VNARHAEGGSEPLAYCCIKTTWRWWNCCWRRRPTLQAADKLGEAALHLAVDRGYHDRWRRFWWRAAPEVNVAIRAGSAPLDEAARRGYAGIVDLLLAHGAHPDEENPETGATPLKRSRAKGHAISVAILPWRVAPIRRGAIQRSTALENAARGRHADVGRSAAQPRRPALAQAGPMLLEAAIKGQTDIAICTDFRRYIRSSARLSPEPLRYNQAPSKATWALARLLLTTGQRWDARG